MGTQDSSPAATQAGKESTASVFATGQQNLTVASKMSTWSIKDEMQHYLKDSKVSKDELKDGVLDLLRYWPNRREVYPRLFA